MLQKITDNKRNSNNNNDNNSFEACKLACTWTGYPPFQFRYAHC